MSRVCSVMVLAIFVCGCSKKEPQKVEVTKPNTEPVQEKPVTKPKGKSVEEVLAEMKSDKKDAKLKAIKELGSMGAKAKSGLPDLVVLLKDQDIDVRAETAMAIERIGPDTPTLEALFVAIKGSMKQDQNLVTRSLRSAIDRSKPDKTAIDMLLVNLKTGNAKEIQIMAADCIQRVGPDAEPAVGELKGIMLARENTMVKEAAAKALGAIGPKAVDAVPALIECTKDKEGRVSRSARDAFTKIAITPESLPHLAKALGDPKPETRREVRQQMQKIGEPAVAVFIDCLDLRDPIRQEAATGLRDMGKKAKPAEKKLLLMLKADQDDVRTHAAAALVAIGVDQSSAPKLVRSLEDDECESVRNYCSKALASLGEPVVPDVIKVLRDHRPNVVALACDTLGMIGPPAKAAIPKLTPLLSTTEEDNVRSSARAALKKIDKENAKKYDEQEEK